MRPLAIEVAGQHLVKCGLQRRGQACRLFGESRPRTGQHEIGVTLGIAFHLVGEAEHLHGALDVVGFTTHAPRIRPRDPDEAMVDRHSGALPQLVREPPGPMFLPRRAFFSENRFPLFGTRPRFRAIGTEERWAWTNE